MDGIQILLSILHILFDGWQFDGDDVKKRERHSPWWNYFGW